MSLTGISANRLELLQIAEAVAREKSIDKEIVIEAIEEAIQKGARARYGAEHDIRVKIDPKTGETLLKRVVTVVEQLLPSVTVTRTPNAPGCSPRATILQTG